MLRGVIVGVAGVLVLGVAGLLVAIETGMLPANADARPGAFENWAARTSLRATIGRQAPSGPVPIPVNDANLAAGIQVYAMNCAACHGGPDGLPSGIAKGLYQRPPQFAKDGVEDDPEGVTYWKVKHGIRFTGMPSFGPTLSDEDIWKVTGLLKHLDSLPPKAKAAWEHVPSVADAAGGI
jgi:thiosulfate dehydrogenase